MNLSKLCKYSRIYAYLIIDHYICFKNVFSLGKTNNVWFTKYLQAEYFSTGLCLTFLNLASSFKSILYQHFVGVTWEILCDSLKWDIWG